MSLVDIYVQRGRITTVTDDERAPDACAMCPNLEVDVNSAGKAVLSCVLERAATLQPSKPDALAKDGPSAAWAQRALDPAVPLDSRVGVDAAAAQFRQLAAIADRACPTLAQLRESLPKTPDKDKVILDLTPPQPVLGYVAMREAFGWGD